MTVQKQKQKIFFTAALRLEPLKLLYMEDIGSLGPSGFNEGSTD